MRVTDVYKRCSRERRQLLDILYLVDRLENLITSSRRMPLVNQIVIKEADILNIVDQMRTSIPDEIKQARRIIQEKERILAQAQSDASTLLARAREETERAMNREGLRRDDWPLARRHRLPERHARRSRVTRRPRPKLAARQSETAGAAEDPSSGNRRARRPNFNRLVG